MSPVPCPGTSRAPALNSTSRSWQCNFEGRSATVRVHRDRGRKYCRLGFSCNFIGGWRRLLQPGRRLRDGARFDRRHRRWYGHGLGDHTLSTGRRGVIMHNRQKHSHNHCQPVNTLFAKRCECPLAHARCGGKATDTPIHEWTPANTLALTLLLLLFAVDARMTCNPADKAVSTRCLNFSGTYCGRSFADRD